MGQKKNKKAELAAKYKAAFDEVLGDPYAHPEPIEGHYSLLKSRSSLSVAEPQRDSPSPVNQARPNQLDFFCDVDSAVDDGLAVFQKHHPEFGKALNVLFLGTYWFETGPMFNQKERAELEQYIGRILVARKISPVSRYFTVTKQ
jgi:hypothetical protein